MLDSKLFNAAMNSVATIGRRFYKASYQVWDTDPGVWRDCEFYFNAVDIHAAQRLARTYCRDNNGQPVDFYNMDVQPVGAKGNGTR